MEKFDPDLVLIISLSTYMRNQYYKGSDVLHCMVTILHINVGRAPKNNQEGYDQQPNLSSTYGETKWPLPRKLWEPCRAQCSESFPPHRVLIYWSVSIDTGGGSVLFNQTLSIYR